MPQRDFIAGPVRAARINGDCRAGVAAQWRPVGGVGNGTICCCRRRESRLRFTEVQPGLARAWHSSVDRGIVGVPARTSVSFAMGAAGVGRSADEKRVLAVLGRRQDGPGPGGEAGRVGGGGAGARDRHKLYRAAPSRRLARPQSEAGTPWRLRTVRQGQPMSRRGVGSSPL